MVKLFEIKGKSERIIYLSDERWKHIASKHPDINNIEDIKDTIILPLIIKQDKFDESLYYYYRFDKQRKRYMMVSVKYLNGEGYILTSFYTKRIRR